MTDQLTMARKRITEQNGTIVITLHRVIPDSEMIQCRSPKGMVLRQSNFISLLEYLHEHANVIDHASAEKPPVIEGKPNVLLTFDDGWIDNYQVAAPHLETFGMKACFFIVTSYAGCSAPFWPEQVVGLIQLLKRHKRADLFEKFLNALFNTAPWTEQPQMNLNCDEEVILDWLKNTRPAAILRHTQSAYSRLGWDPSQASLDTRERLMTWPEMQTLSAQGHSIASHTSTHALLPKLSKGALLQELVDAQLDLQSSLASAVPHSWISYPNGNINDTVKKEVFHLGYERGYTTKIGVWRKDTDRLLIPRVNVWDGALTNHHGNPQKENMDYALFWRPLHASAY